MLPSLQPFHDTPWPSGRTQSAHLSSSTFSRYLPVLISRSHTKLPWFPGHPFGLPSASSYKLFLSLEARIGSNFSTLVILCPGNPYSGNAQHPDAFYMSFSISLYGSCLFGVFCIRPQAPGGLGPRVLTQHSAHSRGSQNEREECQF